MSLIKCPECGKMFSEFAISCPECGCPTEKIKEITKNNIEDNISLPEKCPICGINTRDHIVENKCNVCGYDYRTSKQELNVILENRKRENSAHQSTKQSSNVPHCPVCNSTNIEKISVGKKIKGSMLFGLFSNDAKKQMHCKDCGYKF